MITARKIANVPLRKTEDRGVEWARLESLFREERVMSNRVAGSIGGPRVRRRSGARGRVPRRRRRPPPAQSLFERYTEPIQIFKNGLGTFTRPISSTNKEAQAFFDQGFQMMYAFAKPEAVRSFREVVEARSRTARSATGARRGRGART